VSVAIFGSCVTRDLFEDPELRPLLGVYGARSSVISAVAAPVPIDPERVVISSDWQRRCVLADFGKTFFAALAEARPDWLVIDLIDERFDVLCNGGSFVTRSSAFQAAGLDGALDLGLHPVHRMSPEGDALFAAAAPDFARRVTEVVPVERIVLHRALWCTRYACDGEVLPFPDQRLELCRRQNAMLARGYDALEEALGGGVASIELDPDARVADAHHRWELEPFHYEPAYNADAAAQLKRHFARSLAPAP
jgi:Family of unknown function (DUF6270)